MFWNGLWGILIIISLTGWGGLVCQILQLEQPDWGFLSAVGITATLAIGGILNLIHGISRVSIIGILVLGTALFFFTNRFRFALRKPRPWVALLVLAVVCLLFVRFAGSLRGSTECFGGAFQCGDDLRAYFVYPNRMLQTGTQGEDPFSFRRIKSSLGGQNFLLTYLRCALPENSLNLLEKGIGPVIVTGVLFGMASTPAAAALAALLFLFLPSPIVNTTSVYISLALFLSLYRVLLSQYPHRAFLVALHAAALFTLKSTNIPAVVIFVGAAYAIGIFSRKINVREPLAAAGMTIALLLPWMLDMYLTSGTLLYPIFGTGFAAWAYPEFQKPYGELPVIQWVRYAPRWTVAGLLVFATAGLFCYRPPFARRTSLALLLAALAGTLITVGVLGGYSPYRFVFPFLAAAVLVEFMSLISAMPASGGSLKAGIAASLLAGSYLLIGPLREISMTRQDYTKALRAMAALPDRPRDYRKMENAVPEGEAVLVRLEHPYLLDFRKHRIYTIDWPGGSGLAPGMPLDDSEALSSYLTGKSIRYLAYDYATEANFPSTRTGLLQPKVPHFLRVAAGLTFKFNSRLRELGTTRRRIYDNGRTFVLDLSDRATVP